MFFFCLLAVCLGVPVFQLCTSNLCALFSHFFIIPRLCFKFTLFTGTGSFVSINRLIAKLVIYSSSTCISTTNQRAIPSYHRHIIVLQWVWDRQERIHTKMAAVRLSLGQGLLNATLESRDTKHGIYRYCNCFQGFAARRGFMPPSPGFKRGPYQHRHCVGMDKKKTVLDQSSSISPSTRYVAHHPLLSLITPPATWPTEVC